MPDRKIILVFPFNLLSHYLRSLVLVDRYYDRQVYDVRFAESEAYGLYVRRAGYKTFPCAQFDAERATADSRRFDFSWLNEKDINRVFTSQADCIRMFHPERVIGDMAPTLKMAAELTATPCLAVLNGYMTPYCVQGRSVPAKHPAYRYLNRLPKDVLEPLTSFGESMSFRKIHKPFRMLRHKYKLKPVSNYLEEIQGDENVICDLPDLFPQKDLPANYNFTAPLIYQDSMQDSSWLADVDRRKPVVLVTMGSSGDWERLRFLNGREYAVFSIITAGDKDGILCGSHITARPFVDMRRVLAISDVMICHGGNGTIYQGLLTGVFMLCLASHFEQEWNVKALERIGYGMSAANFEEAEWWMQINQAIKKKMVPYFEESEGVFPPGLPVSVSPRHQATFEK